MCVSEHRCVQDCFGDEISVFLFIIASQFVIKVDLCRFYPYLDALLRRSLFGLHKAPVRG